MDFTQCRDPQSVGWQDVADALPSSQHTLPAGNLPPLPLHTPHLPVDPQPVLLDDAGTCRAGPTRTLAHARLLSTLTWPCFPEDQLPLSLTLASPFLTYGN